MFWDGGTFRGREEEREADVSGKGRTTAAATAAVAATGYCTATAVGRVRQERAPLEGHSSTVLYFVWWQR